MLKTREDWIHIGYSLVALKGFQSINIELLSRKVGVSKSSFYHHFATLEIFITALLDKHIVQSKILAQKEGLCKTIDPELIDVLLEHKEDILFNRELRVHRHRTEFKDVLMQSGKITAGNFIAVWQKDLQLQVSRQQLEGIFELALENFFLQINISNFKKEWLREYFIYLKSVVNKIM
jgi:AcrR family transcriptional regulator